MLLSDGLLGTKTSRAARFFQRSDDSEPVRNEPPSLRTIAFKLRRPRRERVAMLLEACW